MSAIRTIAQGNYILGTQQEVSHDNTLSGNGTSTSPLGVVHGYNETVLWSGNVNPGDHTTTFTLSEPFSSFERIRFEGVQYGGATPIYEITAPTTNTYVGIGLQYYCFNNDNNPYQFRGASFSSTNGLTYSAYKEKFVYWANTGLSPAGGTASQGPNIRKIVGINRIANN